MGRHTEEEHHELQALSEHLLYEIKMLDHTACRITTLSMAHDSISETDLYAMLESFLVHIRTLYEFLFRGKGPNDKKALRAYDFKENVPYVRPVADDELKSAKKMIDKRLVHSSQERLLVKEADWDWHVRILFNQIYQHLFEFYGWVPDDHVCEELLLRKNKVLHDFYNDKTKRDRMLEDWSCEIVTDTGSPAISRIVPRPIGFPIERRLPHED